MQTKAIRTFGADITQSSLALELQNMGIDKNIKNLTYAEKRLVIVSSLMRQLTLAQGDFGKTAESTSNQLKILNEQWDRVARGLGNLVTPALQAVLPYMNAFLMVTYEILDALGRLFGIDIEGFGGAITEIEDIGDYAESSAASVSKLNLGLRSFDKLNNLKTPSSSSSSISGSNIDPKILEAFNKQYEKYNKNLKETSLKASSIRDKIMEWLGFQKHINYETDDVYFTFEKLTGGTILGALATGGIIFSGVSKIYKLLKGIGILKFTGVSTGLLSPIKSLITSLGKSGLNSGITSWSTTLSGFDKLKTTLLGAGGIYLGLTLVNDAFDDMARKGATVGNVLEGVGGSLSTIAGGALIGAQFGATGALIGAISGGLVTLISALNAYKNAESEYVHTANKYIDELKEKYNLLGDSRNTYLKEGISELTYHQNLYKELQSITDENGKIKDGYEERAQFIVTKLSEALGIEINLVNGQVKEYGNLKKSIDEVIKKKKAELYLAAYEKEYTQAIKDKKEIQEQYSEAVEKSAEATKKMDEFLEKMSKQTGKSREELEKLYNSSWSLANRMRYGLIWNIDEYERLAKEISNTNDIIKETKTIYENNEQTIANYEKALEKSYQSSYDEAIKFLDGTEKAIKNTNLTATIKVAADTRSAKSALQNLIKSTGLTTDAINNMFKPISSGLDYNKLKAGQYASGGLPATGQLFVANERGPELVGQIGGQSFVANQNQMMSLLDKKIGNASSGINNATFVIQVGDDVVAKKVLSNLQDIAKNNGKPITIQ